MNNIHQEKLANKFFRIYRDSIFFPIGHTGRFMDGIINKQRRGIFEITHLSFTLKNYSIKMAGMKHTQTYTLAQSSELAMIYDLNIELNGNTILSYAVHLLRDGKHVVVIKDAVFGPWVADLTKTVPKTTTTRTRTSSSVSVSAQARAASRALSPSEAPARERSHLSLVPSSH
jgi:hypothetical protein